LFGVLEEVLLFGESRAAQGALQSDHYEICRYGGRDWFRQNKAIVLEAFDTLFNKRDYAAAARFWSSDYIQHSAHIEPGREGLFNLIRGLPATLRYEHGLILAEDDFVIVHGRFSGFGRPAAWIAADVVRMENGVLAEHWDVVQDEATQADSKSGLPMFGSHFPAWTVDKRTGRPAGRFASTIRG
jgi:predicted SnoaL-like aldol condensation-catalyzing enzyme